MATNYTQELTGEALATYIANRFPKTGENMDLDQQVTAVKNSADSARVASDNQAFFYIDGIPTKGLWVDVDEVGAWEDVAELLAVAFPESVIDEILCADVEGLARHFYASNCDSFSMDAWQDFQSERQSTHLDDEVISAYFDNCGVCSVSDVEDAYIGQYDSWTDFAEQYADETGMLSEVPENLRWYFDFEKFGHDLSFDHFESDGYYFRNC